MPSSLGLDPGLGRTGYGALDLDKGRVGLRELGVLVTDTGADLGRRLSQLHRDVERLLHDLQPDLVVLEDLFVHRRFPRTAILLGHAAGVIRLAAATARVPVVALAPSAAKRAVAGAGQATKAQVQAAVCSLLGLRRLPDPHAADALALAYAGLARAGLARARDRVTARERVTTPPPGRRRREATP